MDSGEAKSIIDSKIAFLESVTFSYGIPVEDISDSVSPPYTLNSYGSYVLSVSDVPFTFGEIQNLNTWDEWIKAWIYKAREKGILTRMTADEYYDYIGIGWTFENSHTDTDTVLARIAINEQEIAAIRDKVELIGSYEANRWGRDLRKEQVALINVMGNEAREVLSELTDLCGSQHIMLYTKLKDLMEKEIRNHTEVQLSEWKYTK